MTRRQIGPAQDWLKYFEIQLLEVYFKNYSLGSLKLGNHRRNRQNFRFTDGSEHFLQSRATFLSFETSLRLRITIGLRNNDKCPYSLEVINRF